MNGEELYARYEELFLQRHNTSVDPWNELDANDQDVWNRLAEGVQHIEGHG